MYISNYYRNADECIYLETQLHMKSVIFEKYIKW